MAQSKEKLGEILRRRGLISAGDLRKVLSAQEIFGGRLGTNAVNLNLVSLEQLSVCLAHQKGVPEARREDFANASTQVLALVPADLCSKYKIFPLRMEGKVLHLAMRDPQLLNVVDEVAFALGKMVRPYAVPELRLAYFLDKRYGIPRERHLLAFIDKPSTEPPPAGSTPPGPPVRRAQPSGQMTRYPMSTSGAKPPGTPQGRKTDLYNPAVVLDDKGQVSPITLDHYQATVRDLGPPQSRTGALKQAAPPPTPNPSEDSQPTRRMPRPRDPGVGPPSEPKAMAWSLEGKASRRTPGQGDYTQDGRRFRTRPGLFDTSQTEDGQAGSTTRRGMGKEQRPSTRPEADSEEGLLTPLSPVPDEPAVPRPTPPGTRRPPVPSEEPLLPDPWATLENTHPEEPKSVPIPPAPRPPTPAFPQPRVQVPRTALPDAAPSTVTVRAATEPAQADSESLDTLPLTDAATQARQSLDRVMADLDRATSHEQVMELLAQKILPCSTLIVVFLLRKGLATGMSASGTEAEPETVRSMVFNLASSPLFQRATNSLTVEVELAEKDTLQQIISNHLRAPLPQEVLLATVALKGRALNLVCVHAEVGRHFDAHARSIYHRLTEKAAQTYARLIREQKR